MFLIDKINTGDEPKKTIVYLVLPLFFLLIVFPAVFQSNQVFISEYHDTMSLMMPELFLMENPLSLWNNYWNTGVPEIASFNSDRFYPFSFPFAYLSQDIFIINLIILINLYIAYLAFYKLGTLVVKNSDLLMIYSLGYMFSGVIISRVSIGHISFVYNLAWIPLLYYFFFKITWKSENTVFNIIGLALCETLLVFTGLGYFNFFANAILVIFFLYYLITRKINLQTIVALSAAGVLFGLVSAIKLIPNISIMAYIQRIDIINPLGDGGLLENNIAAFIFGTPIDTVFGSYETMALIGIIPVLFAIIALVWGKKDITVPSFFAILFALVWADGGRTLLSFIHLFPVLNGFRNAGRIFGAIMPIVLLLSIYGVYILQQKMKNNETFDLSCEQKKNILFGVALLVVLKLLELPWISLPSIEAALSIVLIFGFLLLIYLNKASVSTLTVFFLVSLLVDIAIILKNFSVLSESVLIKGSLISLILVAVLLWLNRFFVNGIWLKKHIFEGLLIIGILLSITANISVLQTYDPHLNESPALKIIEKIKEYPQIPSQIWVYPAGWSFQHMDFTYWLIKNHMHPMAAYYTYLPKNMPPIALKIGEVDYYTADYIIDTAYLENGNQNLPEVTFKVDNISVFKPANVLPNAFVVRDNQIIPTKIEKFSPDEIILSGLFLRGDLAVLKTSFYPGWKINNLDAVTAGNMVGAQLSSDTSSITFKFDPFDVKIGAILTGIGILALLVLIIKRWEFETYLKGINKSVISKKPHKGRKPDK